MTKVYHCEFPFREIRQESGDLFVTPAQAMAMTGKRIDHVWSITDGSEEWTFVYGPPHHRIGLRGYCVTEQPHDGETYYEEKWT